MDNVPQGFGLRASRANMLDPPSHDQLELARAALNPLTDTQRRAVYAVVAYEVARELQEAPDA